MYRPSPYNPDRTAPSICTFWRDAASFERDAVRSPFAFVHGIQLTSKPASIRKSMCISFTPFAVKHTRPSLPKSKCKSSLSLTFHRIFPPFFPSPPFLSSSASQRHPKSTAHSHYVLRCWLHLRCHHRYPIAPSSPIFARIQDGVDGSCSGIPMSSRFRFRTVPTWT